MKQQALHYSRRRSRHTGFTLIEIIIVVAVIAIIMTISVVSYTGIIASSHQKEVNNEALNVATKLNKYKAEQGAYPVALSSVETDAQYTYSYNRISAGQYCIDATRYGLTYRVQSGSLSAEEGTCASL